MGIESVLDLLMHYPRRYVDRSHRVLIVEAAFDEEVLVSGEVTSVSSRRPKRGGRTIVNISIADESGVLTCTFFNQAWRARQLERGMEVAVFGKLDLYGGRRNMANPVLDVLGPAGGTKRTGKVIAIYPQSAKAGVDSSDLGKYLEEVLERAGEFADPLPSRWRKELALTDRTSALSAIHLPPAWGDQAPARRRLAFDELLRLQLELVRRKRAAEAGSKGIVHDVDPAAGLVGAFLDGLPFSLTDAQRRAVDEISTDLARPYPMHRLLQGDVGSGKTVVALATLLFAVQGGYQGALMVPTEVLAEQHFLSAGKLLSELSVPDPGRLGGTRPLRVALLTSRTPGGERARLLTELVGGEIEVLIGTHALLTEEVRFAALGAVVIDEQHRFGVEQRSALRAKAGETDGAEPDLLVMTATPIPRTAAMTVYGDLELTNLDELPPGRTPIKTSWLEGADAEKVAWERVRAEVAAGRQAYVVCPLVASDGVADDGAADDLVTSEEDPYAEVDDDAATPLFPATQRSQAGQAPSRRPPRSVTDEIDRLTAPGGELEGISTGLLHGQLPSSRKEEVMERFRRSELSVLVATTVIEVGVDVPAATVMVVEDADRFGIAQLHQLRGRVGRGSARSFCYLLTRDAGDDAALRLRALERSTDGFELAETDLDLRGEGSVLGTRQKGRNGLRLASIRHNRDLVRAAREVATSIVGEDADLTGIEHQLLADEIGLFIAAEEGDFLFKS
jgi:ATP-dependent DNA helicase RecG